MTDRHTRILSKQVFNGRSIVEEILPNPMTLATDTDVIVENPGTLSWRRSSQYSLAWNWGKAHLEKCLGVISGACVYVWARQGVGRVEGPGDGGLLPHTDTRHP